MIGDLTILRDKIIGNGSFGSVFEGKWKEDRCAAKVLNSLGQEIVTGLPATKGEVQGNVVSRFERESEFMKQLQHPNIVLYYDTQLYPKCNWPVLVMELMDICLRKYIGQNPDLSIDIQISISCDVAAALEFLHEKKVVHRDLCGDNILLDCHSQPGNPVAKVSDFGLSRVLSDYPSLSHSLTAVGRRGYLPKGDITTNFDYSLDIFMFGAVMTMIASKVPEIKDRSHRMKIFHQIDEGHPLKAIIRQCLSQKKEDRPIADRLHASLREIKGNLTLKSAVLYRKKVVWSIAYT